MKEGDKKKSGCHTQTQRMTMNMREHNDSAAATAAGDAIEPGVNDFSVPRQFWMVPKADECWLGAQRIDESFHANYTKQRS